MGKIWGLLFLFCCYWRMCVHIYIFAFLRFLFCYFLPLQQLCTFEVASFQSLQDAVIKTAFDSFYFINIPRLSEIHSQSQLTTCLRTWTKVLFSVPVFLGQQLSIMLLWYYNALSQAAGQEPFFFSASFHNGGGGIYFFPALNFKCWVGGEVSGWLNLLSLPPLVQAHVMISGR